jgi:hypothetical protein
VTSGGVPPVLLRGCGQLARDRDGGAGGAAASAVSNRICCSGRGRSPFQTRAAVAVSGWPAMLTRTMSPVPVLTPAGRNALRRAWPVYREAIRRHLGTSLSAQQCRELATLLEQAAVDADLGPPGTAGR